MLRERKREWIFASFIFTGIGVMASWLPSQEFTERGILSGMVGVWLLVIMTVVSFRLMREARLQHLYDVMVHHNREMTAEQLVREGAALADSIHERLFLLHKRGLVHVKERVNTQGEEVNYYFPNPDRKPRVDMLTLQPPSWNSKGRVHNHNKEGMGGN